MLASNSVRCLIPNANAFEFRVVADNSFSFRVEVGNFVTPSCGMARFISFYSCVINFDCCETKDVLMYTLTVDKRFGKGKSKLLCVDNGSMLWDNQISRYTQVMTDSNIIDEDTSFTLFDWICFKTNNPSRLSLKCIQETPSTPNDYDFWVLVVRGAGYRCTGGFSSPDDQDIMSRNGIYNPSDYSYKVVPLYDIDNIQYGVLNLYTYPNGTEYRIVDGKFKGWPYSTCKVSRLTAYGYMGSDHFYSSDFATADEDPTVYKFDYPISRF